MSLRVSQAPQIISAIVMAHYAIINICRRSICHPFHFHTTAVTMDAEFFRCICLLIIFIHLPSCNNNLFSGQATCPHPQPSNPVISIKLSSVTSYQHSGILVITNFPFLNNQILQFPFNPSCSGLSSSCCSPWSLCPDVTS